MYLNRLASGNLFQICTFKSWAELCWLQMFPVKYIYQQHLFPALLLVKCLLKHQENRGSGLLIQIPVCR